MQSPRKLVIALARVPDVPARSRRCDGASSATEGWTIELTYYRCPRWGRVMHEVTDQWDTEQQNASFGTEAVMDQVRELAEQYRVEVKCSCSGV